MKILTHVEEIIMVLRDDKEGAEIPGERETEMKRDW